MQPNRKRILYIDDDEDSCELMKVLLETWDYEVALASTATEGLNLAHNEHFDMYLLCNRLAFSISPCSIRACQSCQGLSYASKSVKSVNTHP